MTLSCVRTLGISLVVGAVFASSGQVKAQDTAEYTVRFESTWSSETHPLAFPGGAHYSGLIGATHTSTARFWGPGELASEGIERMAESGSKSPLDSEVEAAVRRGQADQVLSGPGLGRSPGEVTLDFRVTREHPLVSLVSMLAPSPDWFVGVSDLSLLADGNWLREIRIELHVYDAGTDSGESYASANANTSPPGTISRLNTGPFELDNVVGTFTFTRTDLPVVAFRRGDANGDSQIDLSDGLAVLDVLFNGAAPLPCREAADFTDVNRLDVSTVVFLLNHLFLGGPPPRAPYPDCGLDSAEGLGCEMPPSC